jgi:hypothetical protein
MTTPAKSLLLTLLANHWLPARHSWECHLESPAMQELQRLGMVKYHSPMNAWVITEQGKRVGQQIVKSNQNQNLKQKAGTR